MKIQDELKDGIVIISLEGKVMGGPDATMFHGKLHEYVTTGNKKVIINLAKVEWMSSVGLGMLISALTTNCCSLAANADMEGMVIRILTIEMRNQI